MLLPDNEGPAYAPPADLLATGRQRGETTMRGFPRDPYHGNRALSARADMASTHPASWVALRAIAIAVLAACAVFSGYLAVQAVHDDGLFELEGNIADAPGGAPDWGSMFDANGHP